MVNAKVAEEIQKYQQEDKKPSVQE